MATPPAGAAVDRGTEIELRGYIENKKGWWGLPSVAGSPVSGESVPAFDVLDYDNLTAGMIRENPVSEKFETSANPK